MTASTAARWILATLLLTQAPLALAFGYPGKDLQGNPCSGAPQGFGPFDYTNPNHVQTKLGVVEAYHFPPEVERLLRGKSGPLLLDLDYVLRAFPNHHRALYAVIRFVTTPSSRKEGDPGVGKLVTSPECYLQRAAAFQPNDGKVELLYGIYLHKLGKLDDAEAHYRRAVELMPRSAEAWYNLGLLLTDQGKFAEAVPVAKKAYGYGYPLAGLQRRLATAGHSLTE